MSIFKTIADNDIALYIDFRSGSGIDISGNYTTSIGANGYLVHKKLYNANTLGFVSSANVALNKSDFTIIAKHRTVTKLNGHFYTFGTGNDRGLLLYNNVLQTRIDSTYYTETLVGTKYDAGGEFVSYGFSADRDANGQFYVNGVAVGTAKNISAKANYDINYSTPILTTYTDNTFETQYVLLLKKALTATEMAQLTAELENKKWTSKTKSRAKAKNILVDGDMKALGTSAWSSGSSAILSKVIDTTEGKGRILRVTKNVTNYPYAYQNCLEVGKTYRMTGYVRGDGTGSVPKIYDNVTQIFSGKDSANWQRVDIVFTSGSTEVKFRNPMIVGDYVDFANIQISEVGNDEVIYKTENGIRADQKTYSTADTLIDGTDLRIESGSWKIIDDIYNGEKVKALQCVSSGTVSFSTSSILKQTPAEAAYGEWEFVASKAESSNLVFVFVAEALTGTVAQTLTYNFLHNTSEEIDLRQGGAAIIDGGATVYPKDTYYRVKITRTSAGVFTLYINDTLIGSATNTTYTLANYVRIDIDTGDKIILSSERGTYGIIKK